MKYQVPTKTGVSSFPVRTYARNVKTEASTGTIGAIAVLTLCTNAPFSRTFLSWARITVEQK